MKKRRLSCSLLLSRSLAVSLIDAKRIVAVVAVVFAVTAISIQPAAANPFSTIENATNLCLGIANSSVAAGAKAVVGKCTVSSTQLWHVNATAFVGGAFGYQFKNEVGYCLGVSGASEDTGAQVVQGPCSSTADHSQIWRPLDHNLQYYDHDPGGVLFHHFLWNGHSGLCLGVRTGTILVIQGFCDPSSLTQQWTHPDTL